MANRFAYRTAVGLVSLMAVLASPVALADTVQRLERGWRSPAHTRIPPPATATGWQAVQLPDVWNHRHRNDGSPLWYRFTLQIPDAHLAPRDTWAVYLPAVNSNTEVWLNGEKIGDGGRMTPPVASNWHRPLFFVLARSQLRPGDNTLFVRLQPKQSGFGYLWPIQIGPSTRLQPIYQRKRLFKETLVGVSALLLTAFALYLFLIWLLRRTETLYAWFAAGSLAWAFFVFDMVVRVPPLPERLWDTLVFAAVGWMLIFMTFFFHRFYHLPRRPLEPVMLVAGATGTATLYLVGERHFYFVSSYLWDNLLIVFSLYLMWVIVRRCRQQPSLENWLLSIAAIVVVAFGGHDNLTQMGVLDYDHMHLLPYGAPFLVGVLIWMLARQFTGALREAEALNRELDERVTTKHRQLEAYYTRLREAERARILAQERERIMRDMHDGTGGHLVSALALVEGDRLDTAVLKDTLRDALDDMRLMIDSLDSHDEDLLVVLGMFRSRIEPRLRNSGITIRWPVQDLPPLPDLGPEKVLQLMRILHEITTNVIKHARADTLTVHTGRDRRGAPEGTIHITVCDNGRGFPAEIREGHGLTNMRYRARSLGAHLHLFNATTGGACVQLVWEIGSDVLKSQASTNGSDFPQPPAHAANTCRNHPGTPPDEETPDDRRGRPHS